MADRCPLGPIRRQSPALRDDHIACVIRYCGGRTPADRDRAIVWLANRTRLDAKDPSTAATLRYLPPRPARYALQPREVPSPPVTARRPHILPWWDYLTHILRMIGGDDLSNCVAKRSPVEATLKELWGKAGIIVPDFHYFKLKVHEAGDATITTTAIAVCESFKHSSDWIDNNFFLAQPSLKYILRYVPNRLGYTVRCPAPLHEFGGGSKLNHAEVKFFGQSPERHNFSVLGTIENRSYLANLTALLQALLYLETHEGTDIVDVNRAQYLSSVGRLDD
ncbi:hypothetical protein ACP4OV_007271 [Aristida adscensionis]